MAKFRLESVDDVKPIINQVEEDSKLMDKVVRDIISTYVDDLDRYVLFIKDCLKDGENPPTDRELDDFCLNLSTYIYFASGMCEQLGIRDDIAKAIYKEMYNSKRDALVDGTVADKNSVAELESQKEQMVSICYTRAYKAVKAKVDSAQELLSSCKKVLSRRMGEYNLTHMTGGN